MKTNYILLLFLGAVTFISCEETINPTLQPANPVYVVDAFVTNKLDTQVINLTYSQPYFQEELPPGVSGALVTVKDNQSNSYVFSENPKAKGSYVLGSFRCWFW